MVLSYSELIGWYNPANKRFCYTDEKEVRPDRHKGYVRPVYAVLEKGVRRDFKDVIKQLQSDNAALQEKTGDINAEKEYLEDVLDDKVAEVRDDLKAELDKHRWIPVDERLPEKEKRKGFRGDVSCKVFVTNGKDVASGVYDYKYSVWRCSLCCLSAPTHWRLITLPESEGRLKN